MSEDKKETSKALQNLFYQYSHLPLGGKEIVCPYWKNNLRRMIFGPFGGKGKPGQIVEATKKEAEKARIDLNKMREKEILKFMKRKKIGIDCSGFVFWLLEALDREKGGRGIGLLARKTNVKLLTSDKVSLAVESLPKIKVGDLIRLNEGKHLAIVISLKKKADGELVEIEYAHSSNQTFLPGVHLGKIKIVGPGQPLEKQIWLEKTKRGRNYGKNFYLPSEGDSIRRLKLWA